MSEQSVLQTAPPATELTSETDLPAYFPEVVTIDTRKGYQGYLVDPEHLVVRKHRNTHPEAPRAIVDRGLRVPSVATGAIKVAGDPDQ